MKPMNNIRIGTAAWTLPKQHAHHFPEDGSHLIRYTQRLNCAEPARERRMDPQTLPLGILPALGRQLGGLPGAGLGAEQHGVEAGVEPCQGGARRACLRFAPHGEPALGIRARPVRLSLGVT